MKIQTHKASCRIAGYLPCFYNSGNVARTRGARITKKPPCDNAGRLVHSPPIPSRFQGNGDMFDIAVPRIFFIQTSSPVSKKLGSRSGGNFRHGINHIADNSFDEPLIVTFRHDPDNRFGP